MKKLLILLVILFTFTVNAQTETYSAEVKSTLNNNGTVAYYDNVVDKLFTLLKEKYQSQNVPATVWEELEAVKPLALDNLVELVTQAYLPLFTEVDVKNMNAFYSTPEGHNMFTKQNLSAEEKKALELFYQTETGNKIVVNQETLNASMKNTSQNWSGNLYLQLVDALAAKGYSL